MTAPVPSVGQFGLSACKEVSARADHVRCEGVLLAVQDQEITVFVKFDLIVSALTLQVLDSVLLVLVLAEEFWAPLEALEDVVVVVLELCVAGFERLDVIEQLGDAFAEGFEGNHHLGFDLEVAFVVLLIEDWFPDVVFVDGLVEVIWHDMAEDLVVVVASLVVQVDFVVHLVWLSEVSVVRVRIVVVVWVARVVHDVPLGPHVVVLLHVIVVVPVSRRKRMQVVVLWLMIVVTIEGGMVFVVISVMTAKTIVDSEVTRVFSESRVIISIKFGIVTEVGVIVVVKSSAVVVVKFRIVVCMVIPLLEVSA